MEFIKKLSKEKWFVHFVAFAFLLIAIYSIRDMLNIILLTFIIGFIMANVQGLIQNGVSRWVKIPGKFLQIIIYLIALSGIAYIIFTYVPIVIDQLIEIFTMMTRFSASDTVSSMDPALYNILKNLELGSFVKNLGKTLLDNVRLIWDLGFQLVMAFLLSFLFLWEKDRIQKFMERFKTSRVSSFYNYYVELGRKFMNSFGKMIQVQIMISTVNTVLSAIVLTFMGFPQVLGLSFLIFILGFIPVVGVVISLIPLSVIAFQIGGLPKIIGLVVMIGVLHALESYVLNPKLTSEKMHMPVFFTFFVLLFGEHYLGVWGLLLGLPLVVFFLDLIDAKPQEEIE